MHARGGRACALSGYSGNRNILCPAERTYKFIFSIFFYKNTRFATILYRLCTQCFPKGQERMTLNQEHINKRNRSGSERAQPSRHLLPWCPHNFLPHEETNNLKTKPLSILACDNLELKKKTCDTDAFYTRKSFA